MGAKGGKRRRLNLLDVLVFVIAAAVVGTVLYLDVLALLEEFQKNERLRCLP